MGIRTSSAVPSPPDSVHSAPPPEAVGPKNSFILGLHSRTQSTAHLLLRRWVLRISSSCVVFRRLSPSSDVVPPRSTIGLRLPLGCRRAAVLDGGFFLVVRHLAVLSSSPVLLTCSIRTGGPPDRATLACARSRPPLCCFFLPVCVLLGGVPRWSPLVWPAHPVPLCTTRP